MRKCVLYNLPILICVMALIVAGCGAKQTPAPAQPPIFVDPDSVLSVIPGDVNGLIYIRNPLALNDEINALMAELAPGEPPQEMIAGILANTFGAGFESLEELEELGLDLGSDFCVFFAGAKPLVPCAAVHLKDPEAIKQVIAAESEVGNTVEYNGMTYNTTEGGSAFAIMGDFLVYSDISTVCEKAIDTYKKEMPSIGMNPDYAALKLDPSLERNDMVVYFPMMPIVDMLADAADGLKSDMQMGVSELEEHSPELAPEPAEIEMVSKMMDFGIQLFEQADTLSVTVQLNGTDLEISPFVKFKEDSEVQAYIRSAPTELTHLGYLPSASSINSMMRFQKEMWINLTVEFMKLFSPTDPNADSQGIAGTTEDFIEVLADYYEPLGEQASASFSFSGSLLPDMIFITDVVDEKKMATYMKEDYLGYIETAAALYKAFGAHESADMYAGASAGPSEIHNGVEIMSYTLPNFSAAFAQMPPEMAFSIPERWDLYYAIENKALLISLSSNAKPIKDALDRMAGVGIAEDGTGHGRVIDALTLKNDWLVTVSPMAIIKGVLKAMAQSDPQIGMIGMLLQDIPETHNIGIAGMNRDGGVQAKLFIALADLKPLINTAVGMAQMMQPQEMPPMPPMQPMQ